MGIQAQHTILIFGLCASTVSSFALIPRIGQPIALVRESLAPKPHFGIPSPAGRRRRSPQLYLGIQPHDSFWIAQQASTLLDHYANLLQQYPITTKGITAAVLASAGDAIAQWRSDSDDGYDFKRGASFLFFGALYTGAFQHFWFNYMTSHINGWGDAIGVWGPEHVTIPVEATVKWDEWWKYFDVISQLENPPSPTALAAGKLVLNQLVMIPVVYMPLFLAFTGLISGLDVNQSMARAQSLYFPLLKRNWLFWLPVQFLQFLVIPQDFQIPFLSAASLVWTVILSSIGSSTSASSPASPSQIVAYEGNEELVTVVPVEAGAVNQVTDDVRLEDVEKTLENLVPDGVVEVVADARTKYATGGMAAGLFASAADEGAIGEIVGSLVGAEADVGVAAVAALGAALGLLAASNSGNSTATAVSEDLTKDSIIVEAVVKELEDEEDEMNESVDGNATVPAPSDYHDRTAEEREVAMG